jgi:signal transduction histidine kinase
VKSTVAGIAHATRLLEQPMGTETRQRLERMIRAELDRIERLLADGSVSPQGPVDLDETLDILLESHRARGRNIEWKPCGARVHGDRDDVAEVLNILLDNAAKHGGDVPSHVEVTCDADEIRIAVRDEGPGVPPEARERIFDWGGRASTQPGRGIGLHVARRLVTRHGGSLTLADQDASGSAFVVRLPAARSTEENHVWY